MSYYFRSSVIFIYRVTKFKKTAVKKILHLYHSCHKLFYLIMQVDISFLKREIIFIVQMHFINVASNCTPTHEVLLRQLTLSSVGCQPSTVHAAELLPVRSRRIFPSRFATCKSLYLFFMPCSLNAGAASVY